MRNSEQGRTVVRPLARRASTAGPPSPAEAKVTCRINAQLETTATAGRRLIDQLHSGTREFTLTSADGSVSTRVRLHVEGVEPADRPVSRKGVTVDWSRSIVANGRGRVSLSNTELRLLAALLEGNDAPVSRATLVERVWPADALPIQDRENALAVYVCSLRKRLTAVGLGSALETIRGVGYRISF